MRISVLVDQGRGMVDTPFDNYLDLVEAARTLGIHPQSLRRLIKQKKVPALLFAGKYLIERDKLEMFKANYDPRPGRKPVRRLL
jgi:excisionase family DNA binding protein